ncbi:MAG: hypothetical protein L6367_12870 [Cellulomonas sp.]|nr:hypothetical protein [Cellulomonas sp.]
MKIAALLQGLAVLPLGISIASLRDHNGWNFELNARVSALRGMRARGLLALLAALMFGVGGALQATHYIPGRWLLLVIATACAVTFGFYRPKVLEHPGATRHSVAMRHLDPKSRRIWLMLLAGSVLLAAWASWPWWR